MCGCKVPTSVWEGDERVRLPSRQCPCSAVRPESKGTAYQLASVCLQKHSAVRWPMQRTPMTDAACCVAIRTALPDSPHLPPDTISPPSEVFLNRKKREGEALFQRGGNRQPTVRYVFSPQKNCHSVTAPQHFTFLFLLFIRLSHVNVMADASLFFCEVNKMTTLYNININNVKNR